MNPESATVLLRIEAKLDALIALHRADRGDVGERFCAALLASENRGAPFQAADLLDWAYRVPALRRELIDAIEALCKTDCRPTARQLGIAIRRTSATPLMAYSVEARDVRGTAEWTVRDLRD